jgi:hypothetical protein
MPFAVRPETFVDVVDLLVPELQRRGRYKTDYAKELEINNIRGHAIGGIRRYQQWKSRKCDELK